MSSQPPGDEGARGVEANLGAPEATGRDNTELGLDLIRISFELAVPYQMSFNAGNIWFDTFVAPW
ncbi:MAG TPA: hypothetical protein VJ301_13670, partial [Propionibacteriaceae bacterium]|nr:hypothetical protein [Propionibacteriaceae bacterium]